MSAQTTSYCPNEIGCMCSRCGSFGRRYSIVRNAASGRMEIHFSPAGEFFACLECSYMTNATTNETANLHSWLKGEGLTTAQFRALDGKLEAVLAPLLYRAHRLDMEPSGSI